MNAIDKIIKYAGTITDDNMSYTCFLHPDGERSLTIYSHYEDCKTINTSLTAYFRAGGLRIAVFSDETVIEGYTITEQQANILKAIIKQCSIGRLSICLNGKYETIQGFTGVKIYHLNKLLQKYLPDIFKGLESKQRSRLKVKV